MINLYANVGIGHENDWNKIKDRVVSAAQCNADAIIINKATPTLSIPEEKKYLSINSKWGNLPYIEVAKRSEIDELTVRKFNELTSQIGIPVIWSVSDSQAASWVKDYTNCTHIKIHFDSRNEKELVDFCMASFDEIIYPGAGLWGEHIMSKYPRSIHKQKLTFYHTTKDFPPQVENLNLNKINEFRNNQHIKIGYEGRSEDIFPDCAVVFKDVDYIEKYLGNDGEENLAILTPQKFYDFFINMNQLEIANG